MANTPDVTAVLRAAAAGDAKAGARLVELVYGELRALASSHLARTPPGNTLQPTALVHEAYLQLVDSDVAWESRLHFFAVASRVLRHILVDYARAGRRQKRGGGAEKVALEDAVLVGPQISTEILALDEALNRVGLWLSY